MGTSSSKKKQDVRYATTHQIRKKNIPEKRPFSEYDSVHMIGGQSMLPVASTFEEIEGTEGLSLDDVDNFGIHWIDRRRYDRDKRRENIERASQVTEEGFKRIYDEAMATAEDQVKKAHKGKKAFDKESKSSQKKIHEIFVVEFAKGIGLSGPKTKYSSSLDGKVKKVLSMHKSYLVAKKFRQAGSLQSATKITDSLAKLQLQEQNGEAESKVDKIEHYVEMANKGAEALSDTLGIVGDAVSNDNIGHAGNAIGAITGFYGAYTSMRESIEHSKKGNKAAARFAKIDAFMSASTGVSGMFEEAMPGLAIVTGAMMSVVAMMKLGHAAKQKKDRSELAAQIQNGTYQLSAEDDKDSALIRLSMMKDASNKQIVESSFDLLDGVVKIAEGIAAVATVSTGGPPVAAKLIFGGIGIATKVARKITLAMLQKKADKNTAQFLKNQQKAVFESEEFKQLSDDEKRYAVRMAYNADNDEQLADRVRTQQAFEMYEKIKAEITPNSTGPKLTALDKQLLQLMGYTLEPRYMANITMEDLVLQFNMADDKYAERAKTASVKRKEREKKHLDAMKARKDKKRLKASK